jgi:hypothetical protein
MVSKLAASTMTAASAILLWFALVSFGHSRRVASFVCVVYGLGTSIWSTASQGLWTHTPAVLTLSLAIWLQSRGFAAPSVVAAAIAGVARPVMLLTLPVWIWTAAGTPPRNDQRRLVAWLQHLMRISLPAAVVVAAGLFYNFWLLGSFFGTAEERTTVWKAAFGARSMWDGNLAEGVAGLLVSPSRGLLVYSPIVLLAGVGAWRAWRPSASTAHLRLLRSASLMCLIAFLAYSKYLVWWAGHSYGPRYLTDILPLACLLMALGIEMPLPAASAARTRPVVRVGGWKLVAAYSIAIQAIGAFCWPSARESKVDLAYYQSIWDWRSSQIVSCLESGPRFDPVGRNLLALVGLDVAARPPRVDDPE